MGAACTYLTHSGTDSNQQIVQFILDSNPKLQVYADRITHATIIYGAKAAGRTQIRRFDHNNVSALARLIRNNGPGLVCVDSVYSSLGDVAPVEDILDLCKKTGSILLVDEAHALGIFGPQGTGIVPLLGLESDIPIRTASLGKAFGAGGGIIAFNQEYAHIKELIPTYSVLSVFSLGPQDSRAQRFISTLDILESKEGDNLRKELMDKSSHFRKGCIALGYDGENLYDEGPIIPFITGNIPETKAIYHLFIANKIYPSPFLFPVAPRNRSMIRWTLCNKLSWQEIDTTLNFLEEKREDLQPWKWPWTLAKN